MLEARIAFHYYYRQWVTECQQRFRTDAPCRVDKIVTVVESRSSGAALAENLEELYAYIEGHYAVEVQR